YSCVDRHILRVDDRVPESARFVSDGYFDLGICGSTPPRSRDGNSVDLSVKSDRVMSDSNVRFKYLVLDISHTARCEFVCNRNLCLLAVVVTEPSSDAAARIGTACQT